MLALAAGVTLRSLTSVCLLFIWISLGLCHLIMLSLIYFRILLCTNILMTLQLCAFISSFFSFPNKNAIEHCQIFSWLKLAFFFSFFVMRNNWLLKWHRNFQGVMQTCSFPATFPDLLQSPPNLNERSEELWHSPQAWA